MNATNIDMPRAANIGMRAANIDVPHAADTLTICVERSPL